jgi:hypothetical protein
MVLLAYIDPGTGSLIFQMLAAALLGIAVVFKNVRYAIYVFFCKITGKEIPPLDADDEDEDEGEDIPEKSEVAEAPKADKDPS